MHDSADGLRRTVLIVAVLNLAYFGVEFTVARLIGSVSLFADSVDFLEDASINLLIFFAAAMTLARRAKVGSVLAFVILLPAVATIWTAIVKIADPQLPDPAPLTVTALGALAINLLCAVLLARHRGPGSLARAAWLSARNDAIANLAIIAAAVISIWVATGWIDIVVGLAIGVMNADAAREVWTAARAEAAQLDPEP
jgi:Co/Zn/Cd efflux system component